MKWIPKILTAVVMWSVVVGIVIYVEPSQIENVIIPKIYLPLLVSVWLAFWYSVVLVTKSLKLASALTVLLIIAMITMVMRWMNIMIAVALVGMSATLGLTLVHKS